MISDAEKMTAEFCYSYKFFVTGKAARDVRLPFLLMFLFYALSDSFTGNKFATFFDKKLRKNTPKVALNARHIS